MCSFRGSYANRGNGTELSSSDVVPVVGLEPTRHRWQRILSPPRLPFQHTGKSISIIYPENAKIKSRSPAGEKFRLGSIVSKM